MQQTKTYPEHVAARLTDAVVETRDGTIVTLKNVISTCDVMTAYLGDDGVIAYVMHKDDGPTIKNPRDVTHIYCMPRSKCDKCRSGRFGTIVISNLGGVRVVSCESCGTPLSITHDHNPAILPSDTYKAPETISRQPTISGPLGAIPLQDLNRRKPGFTRRIIDVIINILVGVTH